MIKIVWLNRPKIKRFIRNYIFRYHYFDYRNDDCTGDPPGYFIKVLGLRFHVFTRHATGEVK